jgi:hypothetical protein
MTPPTNLLYPITDYYYFATAGGAKIWVSSLPHNIRVRADTDTYLTCIPSSSVEEVLDYYADRPVHSRPASCLLRE